MRQLARHIACLRELEQNERRLSRAEAIGFIAAASLVALGLAGAHFLEQIVLEKLTAYFETVPIGGTDIGGGGKLFLDAVIGEIYQSIPGQIAQVVITSPGADVAIGANEVAILQSLTSDVTVVQL